MLKISVLSKASGTILKLAGLLVSPQVDELRTCWEMLRAIADDRPIYVDLSEVKKVKPRGKKLLDDMRQAGVVIIEGHYVVDRTAEARRAATKPG